MLKEDVIKYSESINIDLIGFTDSNINETLKEKLLLQEKLSYKCEFQKGSIEEIIDPKLLMHNCRSIIAIGMAYPNISQKVINLKDNEVYFSASSWGIDYHRVINERLLMLANYIKEKVPSFEYKIICDTSSLCDRTIAYKAGLGFFGRNNLLINPRYGSYIFLGSLLTNLEIEKDTSLDIKCDNCHKCIDACPTKAINDSGILNSKRCLSYITQKKELSKEEESLINQCIYGCDICMNACPYNTKNSNIHHEFLSSGVEIINIDEYTPLSNKQFKLKYGHLAGSWRGPKIITRNIKIYKDKHK